MERLIETLLCTLSCLALSLCLFACSHAADPVNRNVFDEMYFDSGSSFESLSDKRSCGSWRDDDLGVEFSRQDLAHGADRSVQRMVFQG